MLNFMTEGLKLNISHTSVLYCILLFLWLEYLWELYLAIRQYRVAQNAKKIPEALKGVMTEETFQKARSYSIDKNKFGIVKDLMAIVVSTVILYNGWLSDLYLYVDRFQGEVATSCLWMFLLTTVQTIILDLPLNVYYTFVLEEKYGFNKQTMNFFIRDKIKAYVLQQVLTLPISSIVIMIVKYGGHYFFLWLWLAIGIITLLLMTIYPAYIAPYFDKYTPLPEGELRSQIEKLASDLKFPLTELYVVEGSKRSSHSNAYFYGFFKNKRIVLFDTLLASPDHGGCKDDEILAVLSHELGHWNHGHVIKNLIILQVNLFLMFLVFSITFKFPLIYQAIGFPPTVQPVLVGLIVVIQFIMLPYNTILSFLLTCLSRHFEFQADEFACRLNKAEPLERALIQLNKDNLGFPIYDSIYSAWYHSHPPLLERLGALRESKKSK